MEKNIKSVSIDVHDVSLPEKCTRMNEVVEYIQERQVEDEIDGDLEEFNENK